MRAAREGDRLAFAALYHRHCRRLLARCCRLVGDPLLAEELAQQAAVEALVGLPRLVTPERFGAWLLAIATNLCRHRIRTPSYRLASLDALRESEIQGWREPVAADLEPARAAETAELAETLGRELVQLPPGQRRALELFYLRGMTLVETAAALGIEVGAVKTRLHKGRLTLRRRLERL